MQFDSTIKTTDLIMMLAVVAGPIVAVQVESFLRRRREIHGRRVRIFRTLMSTRLSTLAATHTESLNLVELEFHTSNPLDKKVVDHWKLYHSHLHDRNYIPKEGWEQRRSELLVDLLYQMSQAIGYSFDKASIKMGAYSPQSYLDYHLQDLETRKLWLEILKGQRPIPMAVFQPPANPGPAPVQVSN
jgi:hypothetical protein